MLLADSVLTDRLLGRRPREEDGDVLAAIYTDHRVDEAAWPAELRTSDDARRTIAGDLAHWQRWRFGPWIVEERGTGAIVGRAGVRHTVVAGRPELEIAYFLAADTWGRGYATEIAREAVRVAFEVLEVDDLVLYTTPANAASQAVIRKLGAQYERDIEHAGLPHVLFRLRNPATGGGATG